MDEENDLPRSEDVPAKSVADGELDPESVAGAVTTVMDEENDLPRS